MEAQRQAAGDAVPSFGVMHDFRQKAPFSQPYADYYAECLEEIEEAEALGYEAVWLSEHHFTGDGFLPSPFVAAAAIAARTSSISIGTNVLVLPLHHPLRVAEDGAVVDLLSGGRFVLAVGQGYAEPEFEAFGVERRFRPSLLEEGVEIVRRAWDEGRTGFEGKRWSLPDLPFGPRPDGRVRIFFGAVSDRAMERATRMADGVVVYCGKPKDFSERYGTFEEVLASTERTSEGFPFVATGILHVHEDSGRAWEEAAPAIAYLEGAISSYAAGHGGPARLAPEDLRPRDFLVGDPEEVAERLVALHREAPYDHFAFWGRLPGFTHEQALRSLRLFAREVAPTAGAEISRETG